jgi:hypothetical protein
VLNFHPGVRFWAPANNAGAYLSNASGVTTVAMPPGGHTAIFLTNADFSVNAWGYALMFGAATGNNYSGPGYGVEKSNNKGVGRYRHNSGTAITGTGELFEAGATIISMFRQQTSPNNRIRFRFNGTEDNNSNANLALGSFGMHKGSQLGKGYSYDRTFNGTMGEVIMYEGQLSDEDRNKVESYLALKYSITLYPSNSEYPFNNTAVNPKSGTNRYNYKLSDGSILWAGDVPASDVANRKFVNFYNNIAAVIRDDAARLDNRHSHSTNVGSILHLGVAGTALNNSGDYTGSLEYNNEAIIWGNNGGTGIKRIGNEPCADFQEVFNRVWLIHKATRDDRPIRMLVGTENNLGLTIGEDEGVWDYYDKLTSGYDVYMIVGHSLADIQNDAYIAVVPMTFIYDRHQCNYVFTEEDTYISFGFKLNKKGCVGNKEAEFSGLKTYNWTQYTNRTNRFGNHVAQVPTTPFVLDLGDNITATTYITFDRR